MTARYKVKFEDGTWSDWHEPIDVKPLLNASISGVLIQQEMSRDEILKYLNGPMEKDNENG